jgi:hypothetical protein
LEEHSGAKSDKHNHARDLLSLEHEEAIYANFADTTSVREEQERYQFSYFRIAFTTNEVVQYFLASLAHEQYLHAIERGGGFDEALAEVADKTIATRVRDYLGYVPLPDGTEEDIRGCFASFLPYGMEELVCGNRRDRYELLSGDGSPKDNFARLVTILNNFHTATHELSDRKYGRPDIAIECEYDVQDLLFAILRASFDDARREEWTPQRAGSSKRIDFSILSMKTVLEVKFVRDKPHAAKIADELRIDFECYHERTEFANFVAFVFDPNRHVPDPQQFDMDLSGPRQKRDHRFDVTVMVR